MQGFGLVVGFMSLLVNTAAVVGTSVRLAHRYFAGEPSRAVTAGLVLGVSEIVLVLELLGTISLLQPAAVTIAVASIWVAVSRWDGAEGRTPPSLVSTAAALRRRLAEMPTMTWAALAMATLLVALIVVRFVHAWYQVHLDFDAIALHLPVAAQWFQRGNTRFLPYGSPVSISEHYPANAELMSLWLIIPVGRDFLVQLAGVPGVALIISSVVTIGRRLGARPGAVAVAACIVPTLPMAYIYLVGTNMQDVLYVGAVAAVAALAFAPDRPLRAVDATVAGLAVGLAIGTRYAALISLLPVIVLLYALPMLLSRDRWARLRRAAVFSGLGTIATGAYFYVRNQLITGSPVYPQSVPWHHVVATESLALPFYRSYLQRGWDPTAWRAAIDFISTLDGPVTLGLMFGVAIPPLLALLRRERDPWRWGWALLPLAAVGAFAVTIGSAGFQAADGQLNPAIQAGTLRYGLFVLPLSVAVLAAELRRLRWSWSEAVALGAGLLALVTTVDRVFTATSDLDLPVSPHRLVQSVVIGDGLRAIAVGLVLLALLVAAGRRSPSIALVLGWLAVAAVATTAPRVARHYDERRVEARMPYEGERIALAPTDRSIAVEGVCQIYGLYGPTFDRHVEYLTGRDDGIDRPLYDTEDAWISSLRAHDITAVVVGVDGCFMNTPLPYQTWINAHPEWFTLIAQVDASLYRVHLDG